MTTNPMLLVLGVAAAALCACDGHTRAIEREPNAIVVSAPAPATLLVATPEAPSQADPDIPLASGECGTWLGTSSGNDPETNVRLSLCREGQNLDGKFITESERSGLSVRIVGGGIVGPGRIRLSDRGFDTREPGSGWRFCLIDRYDLTVRADDAMDGEYWSEACHDRAQLRLERGALEGDLE